MLAKLERRTHVFSIAVVSWNRGGCVGCLALHELMMLCN